MREYVEKEKALDLWDYMAKKMGELYLEIAMGEDWTLKNFILSRFCANSCYEDGFCCRKRSGQCECIEDMHAALNDAWFCCKHNPALCALFHNTFIRHDIKAANTTRNDLAPPETVEKIKAKQNAYKEKAKAKEQAKSRPYPLKRRTTRSAGRQ